MDQDPLVNFSPKVVQTWGEGSSSWKKLTEIVYDRLVADGLVKDKNSYETYLKESKYPEFFRQAEVDIGSRRRLLDHVRAALVPEERHRGFIYEILSKWPFACYLTTNYDDELRFYLEKTREHFTLLRNRLEDFYSIRNGVTHLIQKLHSDFNYPGEVVLTSADYRRLYVEPEGQYFRVKLRQIFEMFDVFIIGHSLSDPDIDYVLQVARKTASPTHPIYMVAADFTKADEREYLEKYNIVLLLYKNDDGHHAQLRRLFSTTDRFIVPRHKWTTRALPQPRSPKEVQGAAALFLFRRLQLAKSSDYFEPLIMSALEGEIEPGIELDNIVIRPPLSAIRSSQPELCDAVHKGLGKLVVDGIVAQSSSGYWLTPAGSENIKQAAAVRESEKDQAFGQFTIDLKHIYDELSEGEENKCRQLAERTIITAFASRGLTIANQVFAGQSAGAEEMSDIFECISEHAANINNIVLRSAFTESMHQFLMSPNLPQKQFLASISQGYFLFHLLGLDPNCTKLRREIFERTLWICDSSIMLPLIAVGCYNHDYASKLFEMLKKTKAAFYTTSNLLKEAWEHYEWAIDFMQAQGAESPEFIRAALVKGSYKQNLFLDGYIRLSAEGRVASFHDYTQMISPMGKNRRSFEDEITKRGIHVVTPSALPGFQQEDFAEIEEAKARVRAEREKRGTSRGNLQAESEGELMVLVKNLRSKKYSLTNTVVEFEQIYFISQSRIVDEVFQSESVITWTPEAVYRYLSALPEESADPDLLQQCMLNEYFYAGVSFIDKDRYLRFFGPSIDAAKVSYEHEKMKYIAEVEETRLAELDEAFNRTPDLEKPFFVTQMGWRVADAARQAEENAKKRASVAEEKVKELEAEKSRAWKARAKKREDQEAARLRNLRDPKLMRKRKRQAKKRKKRIAKL